MPGSATCAVPSTTAGPRSGGPAGRDLASQRVPASGHGSGRRFDSRMAAARIGHSCPVDSINLDRRFIPWQFGIGHSQLLLRGPGNAGDAEHLSVLFEGVRAVKLRASYHPLQLRQAEPISRERILDFAEVPFQHRRAHLCLTLPVEDSGFVVCARATVLSVEIGTEANDRWWPEHARVLHAMTNDTAALA
jgi:hypothetical protein